MSPDEYHPGGVAVVLVQVVLPCGQLLVAVGLGEVVPVVLGAPGVLVLPGVAGTVLDAGDGVIVEPGVVEYVPD